MEGRRQHVLEIAQQLFLENGFAQTSIQDIIKAAHISKGTFYNYFASKNECLIAILSHAQKEAFERRKQLLLANRKDDQRILAKQIVIRMQVNKEQNLLPLFGFVFHSKDEELRSFAKTYHLYEIAWLSERFTAVYGEEINDFAVDCAVFVLGLTQQYSLVWSFYVDEEVATNQLIMFILRRMKAVVTDFIQEKESFIHPDLLSQVETVRGLSHGGDHLIKQFKNFEEKYLIDDSIGKQYVQFIVTELIKDQPRIYLLQSIIDSLWERYKGTNQAEEITALKEDLLNEYF